MRELRLVAVDEDGGHLLLRHDSEDPDFRLAIDDRLHAALRGDRARLGQLEIEIDSQLRPRDIQARVRAGDSVESVAQVAGVPLDRVLRFARPVLAEREHVADRARRARVRRAGGEGPGPVLEDAVTTHVAGAKGDPASVAWDAWRREDGRWVVAASWRAGGKSRGARFSFDPSGLSVLADDQEARAVSGERREPEPAPAPARLAVVKESAPALPSDSEAPTGPVPSLVPAPTATSGRPRREDARRDDGRLRLTDLARHVEEIPVDEAPDLDDAPVATGRTSALDALGAASAEPPAGPQDRSAPEVRPAAGRHKSRPSVPSWDEIMFGRRRRSGD